MSDAHPETTATEPDEDDTAEAMDEDWGPVVSFLDARYGTMTAARALWQWVGGREETVHAEAPQPGRWARLWELADDEPEPGRSEPTRVRILRQALFDHRSDPLLLDHLHARALGRLPDAAGLADVLVSMLERLRPAGFPTAPLRAALAAFPAATWEDAFTVLAPALDEWLGDRSRELLAERCRIVEPVSAIVEALIELRDDLREAQEEEAERDGAPAADDELEITPAERAVARLKGLSDAVARLELDAQDPLHDTLARAIQRLERRLSFRRSPQLKSAVAGISSILLAIDAVYENPYQSVGPVAEGLRCALWATVPSFDPDPFDPEPEPEPQGLDISGEPASGPSEGKLIDRGQADLGEVKVAERGAEGSSGY